jgi:Protein of unknown function (DUF3570)
MQLNRRKKRGNAQAQIGGSLAAATCALLGPGAPTVVHAQELTPWAIDTAMLYYGASDGRVMDFSLNAIAVKELREDSLLTATLAFDTLTGATPSGAVPTSVPQTFTRPSGDGSFVVAAGDTPLDDSFQDTRTALGVSYKWPLTRLMTMNVGASLSDEYDYTHTGLNAQIARDFNNRNTTLSFGLALASDTIDPVGGSPVALSPMLGQNNDANKRGDESKDVVDVLFGVTQVLNRHALVQFNYSLSQSDGYLTDPYKILSVVDDVTGLPVAGPAGSGRNLYLYESRPGTRDKQSIYGLYKRDFDGDVFDVSYRYMTDDWGVDSHTIDLHYRWQLDGGKYLQPHLRFYTQNQADFYATVLFDGAPVPQHVSADYRLGKFDAVTIGLKYGQDMRNGKFSARLEFYQQTGEADAAASVGALTNFDLYPDLNAVIAQFSYDF